MNIEMQGVSRIEDLISRTDYLEPRINKNDREPSWDGQVEVYKVAGDTHSKKDLESCVPVQVKGCHKNRHPKSISFSVDVADLKNYLIVGGTIFFVVYVSSDGERKTVYYNELLPYLLKRLCREAGRQETKTIHLKKLPENKADITNIFFNFSDDMQRQRTAISLEELKLEDLIKGGNLQGLSFRYTDIEQQKKSPFEYLFNNRLYLYATIEHGIEIPIDYLENGILSAASEIKQPVSVAGKTYFDSYKEIYEKTGKYCSIGKCLSLKSDTSRKKVNITFSYQGSIDEQINGIEFLMDAVDNKRFSIGSTPFNLDTPTSYDQESLFGAKQKAYLQFLIEAKKVLELLHVQTELKMEELDENSKGFLQMLIAAFIYEQEIVLEKFESKNGIIKVGNLYILVHIELNDETGQYVFSDFFSNTYVTHGVTEDGTEFSVPMGIVLDRNTLLMIDNVDYAEIIKTISVFKKTDALLELTNKFLLEILHAYDLSNDDAKKTALIKGANTIIDWLFTYDNYNSEVLLLLNKLQIIRRIRPLNEEEKNELCVIIEDQNQKEDFLTGAYLLLDNQVSAERHFNKMSVDEQKEFKEYPIYHFWKK